MSFSNIIGREQAEALIPEEGARQIITATTQASAALALCRRATMSSKVFRQPVLSALPEAFWVESDGGLKQTTEAAWEGVELVAEELAVVVPIKDDVLADSDFNLWNELREPLGERFAQRIDQAVFSGERKPPSWPEAIIPAARAAGNVVAGGSTPEQGGVLNDAALTMDLVEDGGFEVTGWAAARGLRGALRRQRNAVGDLTAGFITDRMWDVPISYATSGSIVPPSLAVAGDFQMGLVGVRQDLTMQMFTEGVISDEQGRVVLNLMQQDSSALRATMRVAFAVANPATLVGDDGYPFAVLEQGAGNPGDGGEAPETRTVRKAPAKA